HETFYVNSSAPRGTSAEAAAAVAAHHTLVTLYPRLTASFDIALGESLGRIADSAAKTNGVSIGYSVAELYLKWRLRDGQGTRVAYKPTNDVGHWQPTPPEMRAALLPEWAGVPCFALRETSQFRAAGPPPLTSEEFAAAYREVKELG